MARLSYIDTIGKSTEEGVNLVFNEENIPETAQMLEGMMAWFRLATGRTAPVIGLVEDVSVTADPPVGDVIEDTPTPKKSARKKRRTKAEMEADTESSGPAVSPFNGEDGPEEEVQAPTPDAIRAAAEAYLGDAGSEGPGNFKKLLGAHEAKKISELDNAGRIAVMAKLLETQADG